MPALSRSTVELPMLLSPYQAPLFAIPMLAAAVYTDAIFLSQQADWSVLKRI